MKIKMLINVRPEFLIIAKPGTILRAGWIYEAKLNKNGAVSGLCDNGEWLGVKPDEFERVDVEDIQNEIIKAIIKERERQDSKWGEQNHELSRWTGILGEEYGELCEAINETVFDNGTDKGGYENMRKEAIHVAAVAVGFLEYLERNKSWFEEAENE